MVPPNRFEAKWKISKTEGTVKFCGKLPVSILATGMALALMLLAAVLFAYLHK